MNHLAQAEAALRESLERTLTGLVTGTAQDLADGVAELSDRALRAALEGRQDLVDEVADQARLILERRRLLANAAGWQAAREVVRVGGGLLAELIRTQVLRVSPGT